MYVDLWNISKTHALLPQNINVHFLCNQKIHDPSWEQGFVELLWKKDVLYITYHMAFKDFLI